MTGSTLGTSWDSLQLEAVTSRASIFPAPGWSRGGRRRRAPGGAWLGVSRETHCSRWPAWLSNRVTSAARLMGGLFWKISALSCPADSAIFSPFLINALISPQLLLFLEMRFLFLLQGHDPTDPKPLTHLYILCALAFLSSFSPHLSARHIHSVKVVCGMQGQMLLRQQACKPVCRSRCFGVFPHLHLKAPGQQPQSKPSP